MKVGSVGMVSALIYTSISLVGAAIFFVVASIGNHDWVTRVGGSAWVFLLSMIILMPIVTPLVKRRLSG